jgi:hypothetical protein
MKIRLQIGLLFWMMWLAAAAHAQYYQLKQECKLPAEINETSGIEAASSQEYWTHNDGGNAPYVYKVNKQCQLIKKVKLLNIPNVDIEDIALDDSGRCFIGDFGNNNNDRKDLVIYVTTLKELNEKDSVSVGKIRFTYADQVLFPPAPEMMNFDCEAFFYKDNFLYLFSKNRGTSKFTKCYKLLADTGLQTAVPIDSFETVRWITGADMSPDKKQMALLSDFHLFLFNDWPGDAYFKGKDTLIGLSISQKEGICFVNDSSLVFTDENGILPGGNLYSMLLPSKKQENSVIRYTNMVEVKIGNQAIPFALNEKIAIAVLDILGNKQISMEGEAGVIENYFRQTTLLGYYIIFWQAGKRQGISSCFFY